MQKIYFIIYWYENEIEGHMHCDNKGNPVLFNDREAAFSYLEELKYKNPNYTFSLRSTRPETEVIS